MKIAMIGWEYPPHIIGGLGKHCYNLCKNLLKNPKNEIHFFSPQFFDEKSYTDGNFHMHKIPGIVKGKIYSHYSMNENIGSYDEKISKIIDDIKPDIVHGHDWVSIDSLKSASEKNYKTILTLHSLDYMRSGLKTSISDLEKEGCEIADKIITVSKWMKNAIIEKYNIKPKKIEVIYNGIEKFDIGQNDEEKSKKLKQILGLEGKDIVLYIGRMTIQKGIEYILYAAKKMNRDNTTFIFAGNGNTDNLKSFAKSLGVDAKFFGFIPEDEKKLYYMMADVFVSPSLYEPFGITIGEALSVGTPVLATQSGITELLKDGKDFILFEKKNSDDLATKLSMLLNNKELAHNIGENGKKTVEKISWKDCALKTEKLYRRLI